MTEFATAQQIAAGVAAGRPGAEQALVQTYAPMLLKILQMRGIAQAEDICQEALLVVLLRLRERGLDEPEKLPQFLRSTALNINIREIRRESRQHTQADSDAVAAFVGRDRPDAHLLRARRRAALSQMIAQLGQERDRRILHLFYIQERDKGEICDFLGIDDSKVNSVLHRARKRLKVLIEAAHVKDEDSDLTLEDPSYG